MKNMLKKYNQEHLIKYYDLLDDIKKEKFIEDINKIDFEFLNKLIQEETSEEKIEEIKPIKPVLRENLTNIKELENIGKEIVEKKEFALITMAGGQGTRLGFNGPKGKFKICDKSLFEIISETIKGKNIPWLIMTSEENHDETEMFFKENNNFGIEKVVLFKQKMLPLTNEEGKILIGENGFIKFGADGSGGVFNALYKNNLIEFLEENNIKWTFINGIDNCLTNPVDYLLLGLAASNNLELACKSIIKANPNEKVGVFCYINNLPSVIEYINLAEDMSTEKNENGEYKYFDAHVLSNLLSISLLKKIENKPLTFYKAHKKNNYMDELGNIIISTKPNSYKYESFFFDGFKYTNDFLVLRVSREDEFAPLKNSDESLVDCPRTATQLYINYKNKKKDV